ncbi:zinc finger SWIM domain-containing protein 7 isoform 2-T3 [Molossus nigricans]
MRDDAWKRHCAPPRPVHAVLLIWLPAAPAGPSEEATSAWAMAVALAAATLPTVVEELLSEMAAAVREGARIPDEHLLSLKFVFGSSALQALDLVDRQSITLISSPSGRHVYQVLGSSGKTYTCLASCHYCSCPAFAFSVLRKNDSLLVMDEALGRTR